MNHIRRHDADRLIGELVWEERPGRTFECHLDVESGHQRQGVGRSMVTELEDIVKDRQGMSIYSFCAGDNAAALLFFRALGFRPTFAPDFYGTGRDGWFLWKPIGDPR